MHMTSRYRDTCFLGAGVTGGRTVSKCSLIEVKRTLNPFNTAAGFLLGTRQTLLETKDGGKSWFSKEIPSAQDEDFNYRFNSISFSGNEGWIVGKPAILLHTSNAGDSWERVPLSSRLPGTPVRTCSIRLLSFALSFGVPSARNKEHTFCRTVK